MLQSSTRAKSQRGVIVVLMGGALLLFALLAGLAIGLGIVATVNLSAQNIANSAALAGIEEWVTSASTSSNLQRAQAVRTRVETVIANARIPGFFADTTHPFGEVRFSWQNESADHGVKISFGRYYPIATGNVNAEPCALYPCFVEYSGSGSASISSTGAIVNAVKVSVHTVASNPLLAPFTKIFSSSLSVSAEATGSLVQRCTALLVDLSGSSFIETHLPSSQIVSAPAPFPRVLSLDQEGTTGGFAFNSNYRNVLGSYSTLSSINCADRLASNGINPNEPAPITWCNMRPSRWQDVGTPPPGRPWDGQPWPLASGISGNFPTAASHPFTSSDSSEIQRYRRTHYRDDFKPNSSYFYGNNQFLIDEYVDAYYQGPEPFTSYMQGFNAALRTLQQQQTALDSVSLKGFAGNVITTIPPYLYGGGGTSLSSDLGYLIQITNLNNRGTFTRGDNGIEITVSPQITPNFIDHGFFTVPIASANIMKASTNMVEVLDSTIQQLATTCPANAKKQIILATDGVSTCSFLTHSSSTSRYETTPSDNDTTRRICLSQTDANAYSNYLLSEWQLIGEEDYSIPGSPHAGRPSTSTYSYPSIVERAREEQIAITVLLAGSYVEPNFINYLDADSADQVVPFTSVSADGALSFLPYQKALAFGFTGLNEQSSLEYVNTTSTIPADDSGDADEGAFANLGQPGYIFRRPNGALARLSMRSGGLWCPLQQPADSSCYDSSNNLIDSCRTQTQVASPFNIQTAALASQCASAAVGYNPYLLAESFQSCPNAGTAASPRC